jgi:hypothetical protein
VERAAQPLIPLAADAIVVVMSTNRDDQIDDLDHGERIQKLKEQARQKEDFWRRIVEFENAPLMTDAQRLADAGIDLPWRRVSRAR